MDEYRLYQLRRMPYTEYLKTPEWKAKRKEALERDSYRCRVCNTNKNLDVHHRTYEHLGNEPLDDLTVLCKGCHDRFHKEKKQQQLLQETYIPPIKRDSQEEVIQRWEYYLLGLLIQNPGLCLHVCGIVSEKDFASPETKALYGLLNSTYQRTGFVLQSIESLIPVELQSAVEIARAQAGAKPEKDGAGLIKEAVQATIRLKRMNLIQMNTQLKYQIQEAAESGDKQLYKRLLQEHMALRQQRQVLDAATHLQG